MKTITEAISKLSSNRRLADFLFILWAGGAALLSYSLVYTLRKPFTAATFDGIEAFGFDYKVLVTIIQIAGYLIAKFIGIKLISELKRENRLKFILVSIAVAELSLVAFGALPTPYNMFAMFFNGLSLGCMWGVIFSFIEGRRTTDILASLLGISIVISSGTAKSIGLFVMNTLNVSEFWMPALIGAFALPLLALLGYSLTRLPQPTAQDIEQKSSRVTLNGKQRKELFIDFMPFLVLLFVANLMLVVLRDIKEDFLVKIIDMNGQSSWMFAQVDTVVTLIILALFGAMVFVKSNIKVLVALLGLVVLGTATMSFISFNYDSLQLDAITWLFVQSLCLYIAYLCFQSIFFDRFIACFKIKGNVGFFIVTIDFIGYTGTVLVLMFKEFAHADINWLEFYNILSGYVGLICTVAFTCSMIYLIQRYKKEKQLKKAKEAEMSNGIKFTGEGMEPTTFHKFDKRWTMKIIGLYLKFSFLLSLILTTSRITAQNLPDGIQYKITGRLLMDGGVYLKNPNNFGNGTEFNDLRIGVKATYQNWGMKLEMGYAGNKVAIKDAFATYSYKNSSIQIGQFYEPFSLDMICSTFDLRFNQSPGAVLALTNSRRMGVAYSYRTQYYYLCGGFFTDNDLSNLKNASQGYAIDGRLVYRPLYEQAKLIHIGLAAIHRTPDGTLPEDENRNTFTYKSPGVSTIDNRTLIQADVDHAASQFKIGTELLIYYHKFFLQSEYIRAHVKREKGFENYTAQGAYLQCSWLLLGQNYLYDEEVACPGRPEGKALELCARFNYLSLNDAGIKGGTQKDLSFGLNYYINKHIAVKLNYSYFIPGSHIKEIESTNFSVVQGRFQFIF